LGSVSNLRLPSHCAAGRPLRVTRDAREDGENTRERGSKVTDGAKWNARGCGVVVLWCCGVVSRLRWHPSLPSSHLLHGYMVKWREGEAEEGGKPGFRPPPRKLAFPDQCSVSAGRLFATLYGQPNRKVFPMFWCGDSRTARHFLAAALLPSTVGLILHGIGSCWTQVTAMSCLQQHPVVLPDHLRKGKEVGEG
jgi:hypothetical protein